MSDPPPKLVPKDLFEKRTKRDQSRLKVYNQILTQIYQRIYTISQINGNTTHILYTVPPFILGSPKVDLEDCIVYVVYMLRQNTYEVRFTYPNFLYISWRHHEKDYLLHQNPIVQAMTPEPVATKKRTGGYLPPTVSGPGPGKKQVTFYNEQNQQQQNTVMNPSQNQPQKRNASEYEPPSFFVDTLQKPTADKKNDLLTDLWAFS